MDGQVVSMNVPRAEKKLAIIGTAPSWKFAPFHDPSVQIACLNDGYMLNIPRANVWFDLHPFDEFFYRPKHQKAVHALEVPTGAYVRPEGHIEWLAAQPIPVFVQKPVSPNMIAFPFEELRAKFRPYFPKRVALGSTTFREQDYFQSTPAWMLAWAIAEGYTEVQIFGIHLATEWEYIRQRGNMECLAGIAGAIGVTVVFPDASPVCQGDYLYALQHKPDLDIEAVRKDIMRLQGQLAHVEKRMKAAHWWAKADLLRQKRLLAAHVTDKNLEIQRLMLAKRVA